MYESPVNIYKRMTRKEISEKEDEYIIATIETELGCYVDREELVKALAYDRDQYRKGYEDGKAYRPPVITNADRIRSMTDEELAIWLASITDCGECKIYSYKDGCMASEEACACQWHDWLKQESEES